MKSAQRSTPEPLPDDSARDSPARRKRESSRAFQAFGYFRDLGPSRSLDKAWQHFCYDQSRNHTARHPGQWGKWSQVHNWVVRAETHDDLIDEEKRDAADERRRRLHEARVLFAEEQQEETQKIVRTLNRVVERMAETPLIEFKKRVEEGPGKGGMTTAKSLDALGLTKVLEARNEALKLATAGFDVKELPPEERVVDRIVWINAPPDKNPSANIHLIKPSEEQDVASVAKDVVQEEPVAAPKNDAVESDTDPFPGEEDDQD
jgi:hypothetical protein